MYNYGLGYTTTCRGVAGVRICPLMAAKGNLLVCVVPWPGAGNVLGSWLNCVIDTVIQQTVTR
jgi:hypothetical protein